MNIMQKATWKSMCKNKKRTLVTIVGVTICVAMISAVCILASSYQDIMIRNAIKLRGSYEAIIEVDNEKTFKKLQKEPRFSKIARMNMLGTASLNEGDFHIKNNYRTELSVYGFDTERLDMIGVKLAEGTLPQSEDEIVLARELMNDNGFDYEVGDKISLPLYEEGYDELLETVTKFPLETKTFTITGIIDTAAMEDQKDTFAAYTKYQKSSLKQNVLVVNFETKDDFYGQLDKIKGTYKLQDDNIITNYSLLLYNGVEDSGRVDTILYVCIILFIIILIGGVSLIYNAFSISLSERSRQLGMFTSVGATRRQKRDSVLFEAGVIALIAIPLGILSSIAGLWITFFLINPYLQGSLSQIGSLHVIVNWWGILFTVLFAMLILLISAWIPARRAARISAISAIRQNKDIRIPHKKANRGRITRFLFGIEGELGLKNMKRNRSRYLSTLFSLIICIVLFMSSSYFSQSIDASYRMSKTETTADIVVSITTFGRSDEGNGEEFSMPEEKAIQDLLHPSHAKSSLFFLEENISYGEDMAFTDEAKQFIRESNELDEEEIGEYESFFPHIIFNVLDDATFKEYCAKQDISLKQFTQTQPSVILVNTQTAQYNYEKKYKQVTWLKVNEGDTLHFRTMEDFAIANDVDDAERNSQHVKIAKVSEKAPLLDYDKAPRILMVTNMENFNKLNENIAQANRPPLTPMLHYKYRSDQPQLLEQELTTLLENYGIAGSSINNYYAARMENEQQTLLLNVMLYGFITLIVLICAANILNTVNTSVSLRKREFAMICSIGITRAKFNKMIGFEIIFYGIKACIYGIPLGILAMMLMNYYFRFNFIIDFNVNWLNLIFMVILLFIILTLAMMYAIHKIRKDNIVETIRQESI